MKTGKRKPNVYTSVGAIKEDLKETERLIDLIQRGRLTKRRNLPFEKRLLLLTLIISMIVYGQLIRQAQRMRIKNMLLADQIPLSSYMTTMGALNMKMDARTKLKL